MTNYNTAQAQNAKISIIIPVYNAEKTITRCLEALKNQTYTNIEVICVDDGSKDKSLDILQEYAAKDTRFLVFTQKNSGPAKARNLALSKSSGEYIMFCDSDDWYEQDMVKEMITVLERENVDIAMCDCNLNYLDDYNMYPKWYRDWHCLKYKGFINLDSQIKDKINTVIWNKIFKRELIEKYDIQYPCEYEHDDSVFFWKYIFASSTYYGLDKKLYNYTLGNPDSVSAKYRNKKSSPHEFDFILSLEEIFRFIQKHPELNNDYSVYVSHSVGTIKFYYKMLSEQSKKKAFKIIKKVVNKNIKFLEQYNKDYLFIFQTRKFKTFDNFVQHDIKGKESLLQEIFSVRNEGIRKVITIFGLRIKIKRK